ncbi:MAG: SCP2 sterol-binding domain-containing protein [Ardenticatenaceae bacterium]|nr:SCP2 sterol-binding domain-containing protein [Anaerolineales bacterium]MCB8983995.1 SCP2 sterol-binding domain-containing protein [Ardenticatenaceae bacterium]MCB8987242.1 SCP2 sterol-binding domain-containing protein [Ardenticatenaceae bacterium]
MGVPFATEAWIKQLQHELNSSEGYREAAKTWEGDFYFVVTAGGPVPQDVYMYMDLWHGECREAMEVTDPAAKDPAFVMSAPVDVWRKVVEKKVDPIKGLMTRQLKLKGNMMKIMKAPKAAIELVECTTRIDTDWPA